MPPWKRRRALSNLAGALLACAVLLGAADKLGAAQRYQADNWIAECDGTPGGRSSACSMTVPFWQTADNGPGSFALVVMPQTGDVGLVGNPPPVRAMLQIDEHPEATCQGARYCIFPTTRSRALLHELAAASLIRIDVVTAKSRFSFILSPDGYRAGVAHIRAWGYPLSEN